MVRPSSRQILAAVSIAAGAFMAAVPGARASWIPVEFGWSKAALPKKAVAATAAARPSAARRPAAQARVLQKFRPEWSGKDACDIAPNGSFLAGVTLAEEQTFVDTLIDSRSAARIRQNYDDMVRDYELRSRYDLAGPAEQATHSQQVSSFTRSILNDIRAKQVGKKARAVDKATDNEPLLSFIKKPLALLAALYSGEEIKLKVDQQTRVRTRTDVPAQRGEVKMTSPWIDGTVAFVGGAPGVRDPLAPPPADPTLRDERYRVSLSRGLPIWDLHSGVSYGSTTSTFTASVSKQLSDNLKAVVDGGGSTVSNRSEGSVKLFYDIRF